MAPALKSFDLDLVAMPDPTAASSVAATPLVPRRERIPASCQKAFDTLYLGQFRITPLNGELASNAIPSAEESTNRHPLGLRSMSMTG